LIRSEQQSLEVTSPAPVSSLEKHPALGAWWGLPLGAIVPGACPQTGNYSAFS
jgi:hypothetical protein